MDSDDVRALDPKDPNYDSEQESSPPAYGSQPGARLKAFKSAVRSPGSKAFLQFHTRTAGYCQCPRDASTRTFRPHNLRLEPRCLR
jgi:hypothetical protein